MVAAGGRDGHAPYRCGSMSATRRWYQRVGVDVVLGEWFESQAPPDARLVETGSADTVAAAVAAGDAW